MLLRVRLAAVAWTSLVLLLAPHSPQPGSNSGRFGRPPHSRRHAPSLPVDGAVARFVRELVSRPGRPPASAPPPAGAVAQSQKPNLLALSESLMSHAAAAARRYGGRLSGAKGCRRQRAAFSLSLSSSDVDEAHAWLAVNLGAVQRRVSQGSSAWCAAVSTSLCPGRELRVSRLTPSLPQELVLRV